MPKVATVVVTYGSRADLCLRVINAARQAGACNVIVVDNGSPVENAEKLAKAVKFDEAVEILRQADNLGSAGGIARGLARAISLKPDDIWILDDDNLPKADSLKKLLHARAALDDRFHDAVFYCYRGSSRINDLLSISNGIVKKYKPNSFLAFSFLNRLAEKRRPRPTEKNISFPVIRAYFGPYGGMFSTRKTFERLGEPREDYFLYADDHEYCSRMEDLKIEQFLVHGAQIDDLDVSFSEGCGLLDPANSKLKVYYQVRNHTHLGLRSIDCRISYEFNKLIFLALQAILARRVLLYAPRAFFQQLRLVLSAIYDGEHGKLGRRKDLE